MSSTNASAPGGITICQGTGPAGTAQFVVGNGFTVNITFPGTPPFRLTASPRRGATIICPTHTQNLTTNTFTWIVETSTNTSRLNSSSGDQSGVAVFRNLTPVFQLGDGVQWMVHEWAPSPDGGFRYYKSANYTVTSEERSIAQQTPQSGGLRVAEAGVLGWLVGAIMLLGAAGLGM